jgi:nitrous oxidase accessory protein NosD
MNSRVSFPSNWRQVSFLCLDLGVLNIIGGAGSAYFSSKSLYALGFARSSFTLGLLLLFIGLTAYKVRRLPSVFAIVAIAADAINTIYFLPGFTMQAGVVMVKLSFLTPLIATLVSMLRVRLGFKSPASYRVGVRTRRVKELLAFSSSMFFSVGPGMIALLLFTIHALPAITQLNNPFINIFHDLFLLPALLLIFPLAATVGELIWVRETRFYFNAGELTLFVRYLKRTSLISRLSEQMTNEPPRLVLNQVSIAYRQPLKHKRPWARYALVSVILIYLASGVILVSRFIVSRAESVAAAADVSVPAPGTLVVSQSGQGQYRSIRAAVEAAPEGATILVRAGLYREIVTVEKDITLIGDGVVNRVTIECAEGGCLRLIASRAIIRNFNIRAKLGFFARLLRPRQEPAAVFFVNSGSVMEECDVSSNDGTGIIVSGTEAAPELRNVRVHDCKLNGILFTKGSKGLVANSDIYRNKWAGIRSEYGSHPIIYRSRIHDGEMDGILVDFEGAATVEECEIFKNKYSGVHVREASSVSVSRSKSFGNDCSGIFIHDRSFGKAEACEIYENKRGGIDVAHQSDAQILDTKVHHEKTAGVGIASNSTATVENAMIYDNGVGVYVESGAKPIIRKSVFRSHAYSAIEVTEGGDCLIEESKIYEGRSSGIYFYKGGTGRVHDCEIFGNANSHIVISTGSNAHISKSRLSESTYAGVLVLDGGQGSVADCEIFNNIIGIEIRTNSTLSVQDSTIKKNRQQGLVADSTSGGSVTGSRLVGNSQGAWKLGDGTRLVRQGNTE